MIEGLFVAVPKNIVDRSGYDPVQLSQFERLTGIHVTRKFIQEQEEVIVEAIRRFGLSKSIGHIDAVIFVTQTAKRTSPCMAMSVVRELDLQQDVMAFDINQSCGAYITALHVAKTLAGRVLVVCFDQLSLNDGGFGPLIFSDAISFTIVNGYSGRSSAFRCGYKCFPEGISSLYRNEDGSKMYMVGDKIFDWATKEVPEFIMLAGCGFDAEAVVLHQANETMMDLIVKRSKFSGDVPKSINEYGNCSLNSIPVTIAANESELLGKRLLLIGYGAGFSLSGAALGWPDAAVCSLLEM